MESISFSELLHSAPLAQPAGPFFVACYFKFNFHVQSPPGLSFLEDKDITLLISVSLGLQGECNAYLLTISLYILALS